MGKIEDAIKAARNDLLTWSNVINAETRGELEYKPNNTVFVVFDVLHKIKEGAAQSTKGCYIDLGNYTWKWHYGGPTKATVTFKDKLDVKLDDIKTANNLDFIYPKYIEQNYRHAELIGIKKEEGFVEIIIFVYEDSEGNLIAKVK